MDITFTVAPECRYSARHIVSDIKRLISEGKSKLTLTVQEYRNQRSLEQNRLMWELLEIMSNHLNGGRTGGVTAWDCYINMLEKYGAKFDYFLCLPEAVESFKSIFRAVKEVERREYNGKEMVMCKCFYGSSNFDTAEMTQLIEGIFDTLEEMGANAAEVHYYESEMLSMRR